jgi:hypothetical protein
MQQLSKRLMNWASILEPSTREGDSSGDSPCFSAPLQDIGWTASDLLVWRNVEKRVPSAMELVMNRSSVRFR